MKKIIFLYTGLLIFVLHFALLGFYLIRPVTPSVRYIYPYFHQSWNLFVPAPSVNYKLYVSGDHGEPSEIFSELIYKHQKNRLAGMEVLVTALSNSVHYFEKGAESRNFLSGRVNENTDFAIVQKFVAAYLKSTRSSNSGDLRLVLVVSRINSCQQRVYYN